MVLAGVNRQIVDRLSLIGALGDLTTEEIEAALGAGSDYNRASESIKLIRKIWRWQLGLGVCPVVGLLLDEEQEGSFHINYREHVVHTLQVYLLGLDLFFNIPIFQNALIGLQLGTEQDTNGLETALIETFKRRWAVAALGHDHGYVLSVDGRFQVPGPLIGLLDNPLRDFHDIFGGVATAGIIARKGEYGPWESEYIDQLFEFEGTDILAELSRHIDDLELCVSPSEALTNYFNFVLTVSNVRDHGICSALILQNLYLRLRAQLASLNEDALRPLLLDQEFENLGELKQEVHGSETDFNLGVHAIAFHNIRSTGWGETYQEYARKVHKLVLDGFKLSLRATPFAWFLAFCDHLQFWHRPAPPQGGPDVLKRYIEPTSISLSYDNGSAVLAFENEKEALQITRQHPYYEVRNAMTTNLDEATIDSVLEHGSFE